MKKYSAGAGWKPAVRIAGILPALLMVALTTAVFAQETVKVTGDRVSLRAAPELNAVLLDRASLNEELVLADNSNPEWVGVRSPDRVDLWVSADYVRNGKVLPSRLNVRSGPSLSHGVVGVLPQGETLTIRGKLDGWIRVAPPEEAVVWISRRYTDFAESEPAAPAKPAEARGPILITGTEAPVEKQSNIIITIEPSEPAPAQVVEKEAETVVKTVLQPVVNDVMIAAADLPELPEVLSPDPEKEQGVEDQFSGILQPANAVLSKLVDPKFENIVICYISGNPEQMETYAGYSLDITGHVYWAAGVDMPVLRPTIINVLSEAPVE